MNIASTTYVFILLKVRKTSQAALLVLLEQGLADTRDVEDQVLVFNLFRLQGLCNNNIVFLGLPRDIGLN